MNNVNYAKTRRLVIPVYVFLFGMVVAFNLSKIAEAQSISHPPRINIEPAARQHQSAPPQPIRQRFITIVADWLNRIGILPSQIRTGGD